MIDRVPTKIYRVRIERVDGLYATMGLSGFAREMRKYLEGKGKKPDWKDYGHETAAHNCGVFIAEDWISEVDCMGNIIEMCGHGTRGVYAAGGGREFALGALLAGASAARAIEIAIDYSDYGGHGVTQMTLQGE